MKSKTNEMKQQLKKFQKYEMGIMLHSKDIELKISKEAIFKKRTNKPI